MPSIHPVRAWIAVTTEEWTRFRALATVSGSDGAHLLGKLLRDELRRQGVQLELTPATSPAKATAAKPRRRSSKPAPAKAKAPARKQPWAPAGSAVRPTRRRKALPVVSDALVAAEARRGAAAAKRPKSRRRGTIAAEGADQHAAVLAKANTRSVSTKKGRPTGRRSS